MYKQPPEADSDFYVYICLSISLCLCFFLFYCFLYCAFSSWHQLNLFPQNFWGGLQTRKHFFWQLYALPIQNICRYFLSIGIELDILDTFCAIKLYGLYGYEGCIILPMYILCMLWEWIGMSRLKSIISDLYIPCVGWYAILVSVILSLNGMPICMWSMNVLYFRLKSHHMWL